MGESVLMALTCNLYGLKIRPADGVSLVRGPSAKTSLNNKTVVISMEFQ